MNRRGHHGEFYRITGACLKSMRETKGVSQKDLGAHLGISPDALGRIEKGTTRLTLKGVVQACTYMGTDPMDLLADIVRLTANVPRETST